MEIEIPIESKRLNEPSVLTLRRALRVDSTSKVAFVGAGGKTTAMFRLAREMAPALVTASTHLAQEQLSLADQHFVATNLQELKQLEDNLDQGVCLVTGVLRDDGRTIGLSGELMAFLRDLADRKGLALLIEADGSRQRPLKAPAEHEPRIPEFVDLVVIVAGLSGIGQPLLDWNVHRAGRFSKVAGLPQGDEVTLNALAKVLLNEKGGLQGMPSHAHRKVIINQADTPELAAAGGRLAKELLSAYDAVVLASLQSTNPAIGEVISVHEKVAGIVLAAGGSARLGQPKQLLPWKGRTFIQQVVETALAAHLEELVVVSGAYGNQVETAIGGFPVRIVNNPDWQLGQSSSVKAGIKALSRKVGAAIILLVDQPQVPEQLLQALISHHSHSMASILATMVDGRRGNPVLFDRRTFDDLDALEGDVGGRAIFSKYRVQWLTWLDEGMALDVDTIVDYQHLLKYEG